MLAVLPMLMFSACSDDDDEKNDYESELVGTWVEDTEREFEVFHLQLNSDNTGFHWATDEGEIDMWGKQEITWKANKSTLTINFEEETAKYDYTLVGNRLTTVFDGETITYLKQ